MDIWSKEKRSQVMSRIRSKNTKPEIILRSLLHRQGYRFRLHRANLPGHPDLVFPMYSAVIFVHGCFWHLHKGCREGRIPHSRYDYWKEKLERNVERDKEHVEDLKQLGWRVLTVWECEIEKKPELTLNTVIQFLSESNQIEV